MEKQLFLKGLPSQILSSLAMAVCLQVDIILVGLLLGSDSVGAYGFASPVMLICTAISGALVTGVSSVCSRFVGGGDRSSINNVFTKSVVVSAAVSVPLLFVLLFGAAAITDITGAPEGTETFLQTVGYFRGYAFGLPAIFFYGAFVPYVQMAGRRKLVIHSTLVMTALDIVLDIITVNVFHLGMFGIGLATAISQIVACIMLLSYFLKKDCLFRISFKCWSTPVMGKVFVCGMPLVVNQVCRTIFRLVMNHFLVTYGGAGAVAAYAVFGSISDICFSACNGIGINTQLLVGIYYGEEDKENLVSSLRQGLLWVSGFSMIIAVLLFIFADFVPYAFVRDNPEVVKLTAHVIRMAIFTIVPLGVVGLFRNYYPVIGKTIHAVILAACGNLVFSIPCIYILSALMGADGLYLADLAAKLLAVGYIVVIGCIEKHRLDCSVHSISLIDATEIAEINHSECFYVKRVGDIPGAAGDARSFCDRSGFSKIDSYMISLCIEEVTGVILEKDFTESNIIEIRVIDKKDHLYVRMRDNCKMFNFVSYMNLYESDDSISHLGVRMVKNMISDAGYVDSLGFNCLTLKLDKRGGRKQ